MSEYARVYLLDNPYFLDRAFEYFIPSELRGQIHEGDFVTVPFGTSNRKKIGLVSELCGVPEKAGVSYKPIASVCDRSMSLDGEMLGLCFFIKEQTLCTVGDAVRAMIPASALSRL
ncbi:MAG: primosomal protein N', partial [Clostridia bacterium]|nr:primosomal protein N' [Clostridia bacterium]